MSEIVNSYKPMLPKEGENEKIEHVTINAVLTRDAVGQFAVYVGIGSDEFVAGVGQKQTYKRALNYYSGLKKEEYRK